MTFCYNETATTEIYTLSLHDALPILRMGQSVHATEFREVLEDSLSWIVHEPFGRIKSCAARRNSYDIGNAVIEVLADMRDRKSTRLNSSHANISYAVFCLKKKTSHYI